MNQQTRVISFLLTAIILLIATVISVFLDFLGVQEANLVMVYILAVLLIAIYTHDYVIMIVTPVTVVLLFNFFFTEPRLTLSTEDSQYPFTFAMMFLISLVSTTLTVRFKNQVNINNQLKDEKQLIELKVQTEQLKGNILKSISHDVRTPLMGISGALESVLVNERMHEVSKKRLLNDAYEDTLWMIRLIENILEITRIQDGRLVVTKEQEVVDDLIAEVMRRMKRYRGKRQLTSVLPDDIVSISVDSQLLIQVMINLVENAIRHTKESGTVLLSATLENQYVVFSVEDDGPGVNAHDLPHIFDLFYTSRNDGARGLGLGLAICKSILQAHDSELDYSISRYGGAKFMFRIALVEGVNNE